MSEWWVGLGVAETVVECGGVEHPLVWEDGTLHAPAHEDTEGERALAALGGTRCECVDLLDAWARCRHDVDALVFASRGPGDHFAVEDEAQRAFAGRMPPEPHDELLEVLRLGGGLSERLIATVAAEWARRIEQPGADHDWARARLHAGLYGRLVPALRFWLGDPALSVDLTLVGATDPRSLTRQGDTVQVGLPFAGRARCGPAALPWSGAASASPRRQTTTADGPFRASGRTSARHSHWASSSRSAFAGRPARISQTASSKDRGTARFWDAWSPISVASNAACTAA